MPKKTISRRVTALCTLTACFALGFGGAHGVAALETRSAVAQARAAASAVDTELAFLESSVRQAHASIRSSAFAHDDHAVTAAATKVEKATDVAASTADTHQAVLLTARDPAGPTGPGAPSSTNTPTELESLSDPAIVDVLVGEVETAADAHEVAERLERTRAELGEARALVETEVHELDQARAAAKHQETLGELDERLAHIRDHAASTTTGLEQVSLQVTDPDVLNNTQAAVSAAQTAAAAAQEIDRDDPDEVAQHLQALTSAVAMLDHRRVHLVDSHEQWVADHNREVATSNAAVLIAHELEVNHAREQHRENNRAQVAAWSNGWKGQPGGVSGSNGRLARDSLCELDFAPQHRLQCDAAGALSAANAEYSAQTGKDLVLTDSYRSYGLQVRTRALKPRTAARPGTSNHGWGMAVDLDRESALWLTEHGADFGWVHPKWARPGGSRPEWWHLEYVATSVGAFAPPAPTGLREPIVSIFDSPPASVPNKSDNVQLTSANGTTD